ncbi:hypothetical protein A1O3_02936 [Capronia epimyces CBS 606.96]|uniref:SET domain-containing protein n=1 Tax=Capronia epimyces CBS 606.96 TaxID=1182542 RepID=W9Z5W5_9EURO|nr:uncharacterized protein A1O3_02936 [Capronia epimyces CBS 606.96]EXJ89869.1 hypothetical protein A1O3_02936 [Capronia epimyces CBS 606.96]
MPLEKAMISSFDQLSLQESEPVSAKKVAGAGTSTGAAAAAVKIVPSRHSVTNTSHSGDASFKSKPQDTLLELVNTPDRGMAVFTRRKIKAGTTVVAERPLILLDKDKEADWAAIEHEFAALSRTDQKTYLRLWDAQKSRMSRVVSIYYSNCHNCDAFIKARTSQPAGQNGEGQGEGDGRVNNKGGGSAIGAFCSRLNHSCVPNVQFSYDQASNEMRFRAIRDIPKGKEVCTNYDRGVFEVKAHRQQKQLIHYGFVCSCDACQPPTEFWAKSDDRRRAMYEAFRTVQACEKRFGGGGSRSSGGGGSSDGSSGGSRSSNGRTMKEKESVERRAVVNQALTALAKLEALLLKEGLVGLPLANTYRSLAKWAERKGDGDGDGGVAAATQWKRKELEVCLVIFGEQARRTREIEDTLKRAD